MALIACDECGKGISDRAPTCPHCGVPINTVAASPPRLPIRTAAPPVRSAQNKGIGFGRAVIGIIGLLVIGFFLSNLSNTPPAPKSAASSTTEVPAKTVMNGTAQEFFDAYERNEVETDLRLRGKIIQISGIVQSVDKDVFDSMLVRLQTKNQFMAATVKPIKQDVGKIAALRRGQAVSFRCQRIKRWVGSPWADDCVLLQ
jgi:hypothetical protein